MKKYNGIEDLTFLQINKLLAELEFAEILKDEHVKIISNEDNAYDGIMDSGIALSKKGFYFNTREYCLNNNDIIYNLLIKNNLSLHCIKNINSLNPNEYIVTALSKTGRVITSEHRSPNLAIIDCILRLSEDQTIKF